MPRLDYFRALHPGLDPYAVVQSDRDPDSIDDPLLRGYESGFWAIAELAPGSGSEHGWTVGLEAELEGGGQARARLGHILPERPPSAPSLPWPAEGSGPRVAICMATFNPPAGLLRAQLDSIRDQSHANWLCVISDDGSGPEAWTRLQNEVRGDPRFLVSRAPRRLGFYRNFERALRLVPSGAQFVALADQDDRWHRDKLERLLGAIGGAQLVYSDARIVSSGGRVISETYWSSRQNNHRDLTSLLVANSVTGAASLFPAELLRDALPFPPDQFSEYHDHWLALTALALGEIAYVDRPLYDYVQHGSASLGHAAATQMTPLRDRLVRRRPLRERVQLWRLHYFVDGCRLQLLARVLALRCGERMPAARRRALTRFLATERSSLALAILALRGARELVGTSETLGAEWMLFHAFAWRRLLSATARPLPQGRLRVDAVPPPTLKPKVASAVSSSPAGEIVEKIAPLQLDVDPRAPARVNLLIPTIDLDHFFGGYIGKFNLARRLAERGLRVRVVTVDPVPALPPSWQRTIESYSGLGGLFDRVEMQFARGGVPLVCSPQDSFVATTWWSAHIAQAAVTEVGRGRFGYLIQEYEPFTFPMGTYAALAEQSYRFPHFALFSSELLRGYFRRHGIGVFASGKDNGEAASRAFQNAITDVPAPTVSQLRRPGPPRLLFYARPEPHAARNMFEFGILALRRALAEGGLSSDWELCGIGTLDGRRTLELGPGTDLKLLAREDQARYAETLRGHDLGLALMYTPHPSLVPIEMASAGMLTVTNTFENKTAHALAEISENLIAAEPEIDAVAAAIGRAAAEVQDVERRVRGSAVAWSRSWEQSLPAELLDWMAGMLRR